MQEYLEALRRHDWWFSRSDDPSVYRRGRYELERLVRMAKTLDPQRTIWKQFQPQ